MNTTPNHRRTRQLTQGALIAALYVLLTWLAHQFGLDSGAIQIRLSEALTILPCFTPAAIPGLAIGCLIANVLGGCTIFDIVFGTLATLLAAVCTRRLRHRLVLASAMPVIFNGVIIGAVVHYAYAPVIPLLLCMLLVALGEAIACMLLGPMVLRAVKRIPAKMLHS